MATPRTSGGNLCHIRGRTRMKLGRERVLAGDDHTADTDEELEREYERDVRIMRARRMSAPVPPSGADLGGDSPVSVQHTISSRVDVEPVQPVGVRAGISAGRERPAKLPVLGRLRQFGGRLIGLLSGRRGSIKATQPDSRFGEGDFEVKRTTAMTNIEYETEHPIPAPQTPVRKVRASHRSLPLPKALSMSPTASPKTPRAPRRDSFLPIESEQASKLMPRPFHARARSGVPSSADKQQEQRGIGADDDGTRAHVVPREKGATLLIGIRSPRSKLDALKTTVFPHPPLPDIPPSYKTEHGAHEGDDNESWDQPVRPVSMISGIGLDASQSEVNLGPSHQIEHRGNKRNSVRKSGRPTGVLPGGGYYARGTPSGQPLSCPPGAQLDTNKPDDQKKRQREARATSMLVGKEEVARNGLITQDGPQSRPSQQYSVVERAIVPRKSDDTSIIKSDKQENVAAVDNNDKLGRFSFSSTLSRRAMRAKSMIVSVGRRSNDLNYASPSDPTTPSHPEPRRARGSTFSTVIDAGVRFDILTPAFGPNGPSSPQTIRPEQISSETWQMDVITTTQDHESSSSPDSANFSETEEIHVAESESELDSMSFARTATQQDSLGSIFTREFDMYPSRPASVAGEDSVENVPVNFSQETERGPGALAEPFEGGAPLTKRVQLSLDLSAGMGSTRSSIGSDEDLREREEMEEEGISARFGSGV
ncbi:hypothetical protein WOLCODRAFT_147006 [Wolfiporia cocos MD-104 SS10]|uniref:Uncharacterized protein n=1 Tax=Wolfiporia cocos (strain MD-104) TaxID=742152 RepID=A0A2H3JLK1_WOLCO|nr:hypothetical protein WOLCODRAFT_147006 [Wolfiporia cocos MD-104 SS10]